mmetsp:Transcript_23657/g.65769  ORF Transcript_23657/g.65769 Transcript_23657/m.65769 type:complete len:201 (-) Transcript_23657:236-838(-)
MILCYYLGCQGHDCIDQITRIVFERFDGGRSGATGLGHDEIDIFWLQSRIVHGGGCRGSSSIRGSSIFHGWFLLLLLLLFLQHCGSGLLLRLLGLLLLSIESLLSCFSKDHVRFALGFLVNVRLEYGIDRRPLSKRDAGNTRQALHLQFFLHEFPCLFLGAIGNAGRVWLWLLLWLLDHGICGIAVVIALVGIVFICHGL